MCPGARVAEADYDHSGDFAHLLDGLGAGRHDWLDYTGFVPD